MTLSLALIKFSKAGVEDYVTLLGVRFGFRLRDRLLAGSYLFLLCAGLPLEFEIS